MITRIVTFFALGICWIQAAEVKIPGVINSELSDELKGRTLIEELNCAACHESPALAESSRKSPRLKQVGGRVNPDYLEAFIRDPHEVKPGSLMPDMLSHLDDGERSAAAEAITHYLVSLNQDARFELRAPDSVAAEHGEQLFHSVGCVACHSPRDADGNELLNDDSVPLGDLEKKYSHKSLSEFLRRPHDVRPGGRMPNLQLPGHEIEQIAHYLLRETKVTGHLSYITWRGDVWKGLDSDEVNKEKAGHVEAFSLEEFDRVHHHTAIRFSGFVRVETEGDFRFFFEGNGGGLKLNGEDVIYEEPSNRRGPKKLEGTAKLVSGWNAIELTYFHTGREPRFSFEMEGPDFSRKAVPSSMLSISKEAIPVVQPLKADANLVAKGRAQFAELGCAQCHTNVAPAAAEYTSLADLIPTNGCLSDDSKTPNFALSSEQKKLIAASLPTIESRQLSDQEAVDKTLVAMNCIACHDRGELGGIQPNRNTYFTSSRPELGNQGRLPPPLTHVGAKLTDSWLTEVLLHGGRQREYLNTRMPQYGEPNVGHLVERFEKVDSLENATFPEISNIRESKNAGYEMMGSEGFSCIACHDFNGQRSGGAGALDLVHATSRLKKNWFHLYMRQPARFHPTVIMPTYWPGGKSIRPDVLDGDTNQQIEALWNYLADGERAKNPKGLSRQSQHLRVADETVMCRGRGTASYRGIGVGYPERISLAFDSEEMALRLLWKGEFASIDHGRFQARGNDKIPFPPGIPFHRLESMDDEWPYKGKTNYLFPNDHGYQYRGYSLDKEKRPTFRYHYGEIVVDDFFHDQLDQDGNAFFRRQLTFNTDANQDAFYFRVASGKKVEKVDNGWRIDRLNLRIPDDFETTIRPGETEELLISVKLPKGETELQLEYQW